MQATYIRCASVLAGVEEGKDLEGCGLICEKTSCQPGGQRCLANGLSPCWRAELRAGVGLGADIATCP